MKISERSFRGQFKRPKTFIHTNEEIGLGLIVTIWGEDQIFDRIKTEVQDYFSAATSDVDVTTPFEYIEALTPLTNYLRTSLLLLNDSLYRSENKNEYSLSCEVIVFAIKNNEFSFASVGQPQVYCKKESKIFQLNSALGLNEELNENLCYLPKESLGIVKTCYPTVGSIHIDKSVEIYLVSGLSLRKVDFLLNENFQLQTAIEKINSDQNQNHLHSFWIAAVNFEK